MAWQLILVLLALTGIGWWVYRSIENRAAELGAKSFEETAAKATPAAQAPPSTPEASPAQPESPAPTSTSGEERS